MTDTIDIELAKRFDTARSLITLVLHLIQKARWV